MANSLLYGFVQLKDLANQRAITIESGVLRDAIFLSTARYNQEINTLVGLFARRTTDYIRRFRLGTNNRLQPADEFSRALPVKLTTYDVQLPLQMGQTAWGANAVTRAKMTVQDVNDYTSTMYTGDKNWIGDHILAGLYYNGAGWSHTDPQWGTLTVKGLANGDTVLYGRLSGIPATDNHYLAQAGGIDNTAFQNIYTELTEHPENAGAEIVSFVNSADRATVEGLSLFRALDDPNVREANTLSVVTGQLGVNLPGAGVFGRIANQWVAQWDRVAANYIVSLAVGGVPPLAMREDPEPELQGFDIPQGGNREDFPWIETQFQRRAGFGSLNRVGACVTRTGNGTYAIPTSMGSPMA